MRPEVACAASLPYVPHAATMLHSVLTDGGMAGARVYYLFGADTPRRVRRRLAKMVDGLGAELIPLAVDDAFLEGLPTRSAHPTAHWYRTLLPELLPGVERVLYLDADLLALDSLAPLWETNLDGRHLAAVTNVFNDHDASRVEAPGLDPGNYFNSGVMLLDLELMRADGIAEALHAYGRANRSQMPWPEQDAMNAVLGESRLALHPRWNLMNSIAFFPQADPVFGSEVVAQARGNPAIRHFEGPGANKPWEPGCELPERPVYLEHRARTPWARA